MSRRREAADLARALHLSTQEARTIAQLSPHKLPSSDETTQDSREMELKAILAPHPPPTGPATSMPSPGQWGLPPTVMTYAQEGSAGSPRAVPRMDASDPIVSAMTPTSNGLISNIASFTPTRTPAPHPMTTTRVPATSDATPSHSNGISPAQCHTPTAGPSGTGSGSGSGSGSNKSNMNIPAAQRTHPYSSPSNGPIPSSRLSNGNPSHVSSSGSSHRNLFPSLDPSLTQTSSVAGPSDPATAATAAKPRTVVTYGKSQAQAQKGPNMATTAMLATIPDINPARRLSPTKAIRPVVEREWTPMPELSDDEDELEAEEPIEDRAAPKSAGKNKVEVVVPSRSTVKSARASPEKRGAVHLNRDDRHGSPDPLDGNIVRPSATPVLPHTISTIQTPLVPSSKATAPASSRSRAKTPAMSTTTSESQRSHPESAGPSRVSKRVQVQREKEEAEKEARREARRIRKEKERLEMEKKEAEMRRAPKRGRTVDVDDGVEESIVPLDGPGEGRVGNASRTSGRTPARRMSGRSTKSPIKAGTAEHEVIVIDDETLRPGPGAKKTKEKGSADQSIVAPTTSVVIEKQAKESEAETPLEEEDDMIMDEPEEPPQPSRNAPKASAKKRKRVVSDDEDENSDGEWAGDDVSPKKGTAKKDKTLRGGKAAVDVVSTSVGHACQTVVEPVDPIAGTSTAENRKGKGKKAAVVKGKGKKAAKVDQEKGKVDEPDAAEAVKAVEAVGAGAGEQAIEDKTAEDEDEADEGEGTKSAYFGVKADQVDQAKNGTKSTTPDKGASLSPPPPVASASASTSTSASTPAPRPPLKQAANSVNTPINRASPGPSNAPGGIKWKTPRSDLASVLSKFGGARQSGMSRRGKIVSLHSKIGPPVKALPPPPPKPVRKKKGDSDEEDEEDSDDEGEGEGEEESDGQGGVRRKRKDKKGKGKGMEWFMVED